MASIQKVTDRYAATTGATKGILIEKAGSKYSPSAALNNTLLEQMKDIDKQVDKWQAKMSDIHPAGNADCADELPEFQSRGNDGRLLTPPPFRKGT